jgi:hypothetical protein
MSKKKRPNKPSTKTAAVSAPPPVTQGNVFATFLQEAQSIGNECMARRTMQGRVAVFLEMKGLVAEFEAWNKERDAEATRPASAS